MFCGCLGLGYAGLAGAAVAMLIVVSLAASISRYRWIRRHLDEQARSRARTRRECVRLKALRPASTTRKQHYAELRVLVDEIERLDAAEAERYELQDLLDHYIRLAVHHQRCAESLRLAGANGLPAAVPIVDVSRSRRRREIMQRRIRHRDQCLRTMERLVDELESIDELIRLVAQRTATGQLDVELDREIDRRLWELDEVDEALHQLSAAS
jgi:hypothetical protein